MNTTMPDLDWSLLEPQETECQIWMDEDKAYLQNGTVTASIDNLGNICIYKTLTKAILVQENYLDNISACPRYYTSAGGDLFRTELKLRAHEDEKKSMVLDNTVMVS